MASVTFRSASRQYPGSPRPAVDSLDLEIADGEFLVLVGPSGCGKSTSLRMLAGLEELSHGSILIGDRDVTDVDPKDRDIAMVFQNYALYPHMTVADNMGFALKIAGVPADERRRRVEDAAKLLDLTEYLDRKPKALSGGQRQRIAIARALVRDAPIVPTAAILRGTPGTYVYLLQGDDKVVVRKIAVGESDGTRTVVTEGLKVGDRVVTDGTDRLRDGGPVRITSADGTATAAPPAGAPGAEGERPRGRRRQAP